MQCREGLGERKLVAWMGPTGRAMEITDGFFFVEDWMRIVGSYGNGRHFFFFV